MTVTQVQQNRPVQLPANLQSTWQFATKLLWASLRNIKGMALTLGLPLFMLFTFWISTRDGSQESEDLIAMMFPAVVALSVMMAGQTQATRLSRWREQGIFERLLLTPTPLANLIFGAALGQIVVGIIQGIAVLLLGLALGGVAVNLGGALLALGIMVLGGITFIAFGSALAGFINRSDAAGYAYFFIFMPLFFLGSFPPEMLPAAMGTIIPWLPTSMLIELVGSLLALGHLPDNALFSIVGLMGYAVIFIALGVWRLRWKE